MQTTATNPGATMQEHCNGCGSTDYEDLYGPDADQGYTACCNKRICYGEDGCRHNEASKPKTAIERRDERRARMARLNRRYNHKG